IEVNPRVQVEHTITEMISGVDIVQTQIKVAEGRKLHDKEVGIPHQYKITTIGYDIQSRVTKVDTLNDIMMYLAIIMVYRSSVCFGVRLDTGNGYQEAEITPYYD